MESEARHGPAESRVVIERLQADCNQSARSISLFVRTTLSAADRVRLKLLQSPEYYRRSHGGRITNQAMTW
jgi:hypothetical protein